ncbi:MAG: GNAT family N-acetyltransferase [Bacteroidota bacterium]
MKSNYERLIALADEVFAVRQDPEQLDVSEEVIEKLQSIHPATLSDKDFGDGPVLWVLLIPTNTSIMNQFIHHEINEKGLYELTEPNQKYDAVYLCSALVLDEYRHKGYAQAVTIQAIEEIRKQHPIKALYYWPFTEGGLHTAQAIAKKLNLPLYERK